MSDVHIGVPSRARHDQLSKTTLRLLAERGIPKERVHVFVSGDELHDYEKHIDPGLCGEICHGGSSQALNRNAIMLHFPAGTPVVQMDDDITDVMYRVSDKEVTPLLDLGEWINVMFRETHRLGIGLWGVYPVLNPLFMQEKATVALRFCIGQMFGVWNTHEEHNMTTLNVKNDYERTLKWWEHDHAVLRSNSVACKTKMYAAGGIASVGGSRRTANRLAVQELVARWPDLVYVKKKRSQGGLEIGLRRKDAA